MRNFLVASGLFSAGLFITANPGFAQTISSNSTTAQTLASGTLTVNQGITLNVGSGGNSPSGNGTVAVTVTGNSTITNNGTIEELDTATASAQNGRAIRVNTGSVTLTINNGSATNSSALIETGDADDIQFNKASDSGTLNNYGTITSLNASANGAQAVDWNAVTSGTDTLNNFYSGTLQASEADAVRPGVNTKIFNSGTIKATTSTGSSSDGIDAQTNTGVQITNDASTTTGTGATNLIEGGRHGITGGNTAGTGVYAMTVTNNANGTIQGDNGSGINIDGINANELVTITNAGTITGNGHNIGDGNTHDGDGVDVDGLVNLNNTGTIKSLNAYSSTTSLERSEGVTVGGGTIVNSGTIEGSVAQNNTTAVGVGITLAGVDKDTNDNPIPIQTIYANSTVTNNSGGLIKGDTDAGIAIEGVSGPTNFTVMITNNANASIVGGGTSDAAIEAGVTTFNSAAVGNNITINDSGTIDGSSSGKAIDFGSGTNSLTVTGGAAHIYGNIAGGSGTNTVTINTGAGNSFNYKGTISNVSNVAVSTNSTFAPGGAQPTVPAINNIAQGSLTLDTTNFVPGSGMNPNAIMSVTSANLTFALGAGNATSGSQIIVTGGVANTIAFSSGNTVAINDLTGGNLTLNQEYVLIDGDNTTYTGLQFGVTNAFGKQITGGLSLLAPNTPGNGFSQVDNTSQLYLLNDNIVVVATPEPKSVLLGLIAMMAGIFLQTRYRRDES